MGSRIVELARGVVSLLLFALFGVGAFVLSPLMLVLGRLTRCQPVVRFVWKILVWLFVRTGLIGVDSGNLSDFRGCLLVANHPSFIDVVLLTVLIPRTLSVSKASVRRNPFLGLVARSVTILIGEDVEGAVGPYLKSGWNVLIFPEGMRSPSRGLHPFHRGAAQVALRTGAPVVCIGIRPTERILAKGAPPWRVGRRRVIYSFRADAATRERPQPGESLHAAACRVTRTLEDRMGDLLS